MLLLKTFGFALNSVLTFVFRLSDIVAEMMQRFLISATMSDSTLCG